MTTATWIRFTALASASILATASPVNIGAANVAGDFRFNGHHASDHATISEGSVIETIAASGDVYLEGGVHVVLAPGAKGQIYKDRLVLWHGSAQLENGDRYSLDVQRLRIFTSDSKGITNVRTTHAGVEVDAIIGQARVVNGTGALLAWVPAGKALAFEGAPNEPKTLSVTGNLLQKNNRLYIVDETTKVRVELRGADLYQWIGHRIEVTGSVITDTPEPDVAYVIVVTASRSLKAAAGFALGTKAIIGGLVIAGAGTAVGVVKANQSSVPLSQ
jgi:hypothetical protein